MQRHTAVLGLVSALLLAGCLGGLTAETAPTDSTDVSPEAVPGVTNGTLSNASALVDANRNAVTTNGAILQVNETSDEMRIDARLALAANISTYRLTGSGSGSDGRSTSIDQWSNETTQIVRTSTDGQTNYRVLDEPDDRLRILFSVEEFLAAGDFQVANETASDGTVVLTAATESTDRSSGSDGPPHGARLVVTESGRIHNLSGTLTLNGQEVTYSYELRQAGVDSVPKPDWVAEVPPGASVQAQLSVDVANDSYLTLQHDGGDVVPSETTVRVESNGTNGTATLDSSLSVGESRYVYFDAASDSLLVSADRPSKRDVWPVTSPVSVRIAIDDGAVLHRGSMAWESASAGEGTTDSGSGTAGTSEDTTGSASESTTSESSNALTRPPL